MVFFPKNQKLQYFFQYLKTSQNVLKLAENATFKCFLYRCVHLFSLRRSTKRHLTGVFKLQYTMLFASLLVLPVLLIVLYQHKLEEFGGGFDPCFTVDFTAIQ